MTHEEAYNIISEFCFTGYEDNKKPTGELFSAIHELVCEVKENTKLKAEIEQLKLYASEIINARNLSEETAVSIRARMQREMILQRENERLKERLEIKDNNFELYSNALEEIYQLKSELEQSVKLPCKVGDVVYDISDWVIKDYTVKFFNIVVEVEDNRKYDRNLISFHEEQIGCKIFLTKEEAEQSLKGQVEE